MLPVKASAGGGSYGEPKPGRIAAAAGLLIAAWLWSMPALAQASDDLTPSQTEHLYCAQQAVLDLPKESWVIGEAVAMTVDRGGDIDGMLAMARPYVKTCQARYGWDQFQHELALTEAMMAAAVSVQASKLAEGGLSTDGISLAMDQAVGLSDEDLNSVFVGRYKADDDVRRRLLSIINEWGITVPEKQGNDMLLLLALKLRLQLAEEQLAESLFN